MQSHVNHENGRIKLSIRNSSPSESAGHSMTVDHEVIPPIVADLPDYIPSSSDLSKAKLGNLSGDDILITADNAYQEIVTWKSNLFKLPGNAIGKEVRTIMANLCDQYSNGANLEKVALKLLTIFCPLMLQKANKRSKNKENVEHLKRRLKQWKEGSIDALVREGSAIQSRLTKKKQKPQHHAQVFTRLMLQGKVGAALRWISNNNSGALNITTEVLNQLKSKHPESMEARDNSLLFGPIYKVEPIIYNNIDGRTIEKAARSMNGSAGPSGIDGEAWKRLLCSKSGGKTSETLCDSIANIVRRLASEHVDPKPIEPLVNCRLIPLDKNPGIRPIGIGEVLRRIMGKAVSSFTKEDTMKSVGPLQLSVGHEGGVEAAAHAMRDIYDDSETQGVLFVDAENAFNSMNRKAALHNVQRICPIISTYLINMYRTPCKLFVANGKKSPDNFIWSCEGTTQGDNSASAFYSIGILPIMFHLHDNCTCPQIWFADDAGAGGKLNDLKGWWDELTSIGPSYGYFPKPSKSWLIVKPEYIDEARELFSDRGVNITTQGHERYLGTPIGTRQFIEQVVRKKVETWIEEIKELTTLAKQEPQLAYSAYTFGLCKRWMYLMRTTPNISELLLPLEKAIKHEFLPTIIGQPFSDDLREVFALPTKYGGLGVFDPTQISNDEYTYSRTITTPLIEAIKRQQVGNFVNLEGDIDTFDIISKEINELKKGIRPMKNGKYKTLFDNVISLLPNTHVTHVKEAAKKGVSSWLTCLPLEEHGFILNKKEFSDAVCLRYNIPLKGLPKLCGCGKQNDINHTMTCTKGGYVHLRHNQIRDIEAKLLSEVCHDVVIEPPLLPLTGERFPLRSTNEAPEARLDVSARGVWRPMDKVFFDVRIFHPTATSNAAVNDPFHKHELEKKRTYNQRIIDVEKATFVPLVFSTNGAMGKEAETFNKRLATLLSQKRNISYSDAMSFVRRKIRFSILRTSLISLRGYRGQLVNQEINENSDIDLIPRNNQHF